MSLQQDTFHTGYTLTKQKKTAHTFIAWAAVFVTIQVCSVKIH